MGFFNGDAITGAARVLLDTLEERTVIRYSEFYDGTDETETRLATAMVIEDPATYSPAVAVDLAVRELEERGLVTTETLDDTLVDGEPDYSIGLTKDGEEFLRKRKRHVSSGQML